MQDSLLLIYAAWTERLGWVGLRRAGDQGGGLGKTGLPVADVAGRGRRGSLPRTYGITHMLNQWQSYSFSLMSYVFFWANVQLFSYSATHYFFSV